MNRPTNCNGCTLIFGDTYLCHSRPLSRNDSSPALLPLSQPTSTPFDCTLNYLLVATTDLPQSQATSRRRLRDREIAGAVGNWLSLATGQQSIIALPLLIKSGSTLPTGD